MRFAFWLKTLRMGELHWEASEKLEWGEGTPDTVFPVTCEIY